MYQLKSDLGRSLWAEIQDVKEAEVALPKVKGCHDYPDDPVGYAFDVLRIQYLTDAQKAGLRALLTDPYRVMMPSAHGVGKTFLAAIAVNWWYDSFDPGVSISTAPNQKAVEELLWSEIRLQRQRVLLPGLMPAAPMMRSAPNHYARGFTAIDGNAFQGRHPEKLLIVFDEAAGVDPVFWQTSQTMFHRMPGYAWLAILNPTDTSCQAFLEDQMVDADGNPKWQRFSLDALDHPNVKGRSKDDEPIIRGAVSWAQVDEAVHSWCDRIAASEATAQDLEWPEGSGIWHRQGPVFLARIRGRWPTGQAFSVWSDNVWAMACDKAPPIPLDLLPELGVDCARFGDDFTAFHVRWGHTSMYHEARNGWSTDQIAGQCKTLADDFAAKATSKRPPTAKPIDGKKIAIKVDDDGVGGGVVDQLRVWGYNVIAIGAGTRSISGRYPNKRSELWFQIADRAAVGLVGLALLPKALLARMRQQALAVQYKINAAGMRQCEDKDETKEKIGRSPDDLDALNLAYLEGYEFETARFLEGKPSLQADPLAAASNTGSTPIRDRSRENRKKIW